MEVVPGPARSPNLFGMADEVLDQIVKMACNHSSGTSTSTTLSLSMVCKRLYRLAIPNLYQHIWFDILSNYNYGVDGRKKQMLLLRTLKESPELGQYCQTLTFQLRGHTYHTNHLMFEGQEIKFSLGIQMAERLTTMLGRTTSLAIGPQNADEHGLVLALINTAKRNMNGLKQLSIHSPLRVNFDLMTQCCLQLETLAIGTAGSPLLSRSAPWNDRGVSPRSLPLTKLKITELRGDKSDLAAFLGLVRNLEHFSLPKYVPDWPLFPGPGRHAWDLSFASSLLRPHASSLRSLLLPPGATNLGDFDLGEFTSLEDVILPHWGTGYAPGTEVRFVAPRMRRFAWRFQPDEARGDIVPRLKDFGLPQANWLRNLAKLANQQNVPLRLIYISYIPGSEDKLRTRPTLVWPYGHMEELKPELQALGIELTWDEPWPEHQRAYDRSEWPFPIVEALNQYLCNTLRKLVISLEVVATDFADSIDFSAFSCLEELSLRSHSEGHPWCDSQHLERQNSRLIKVLEPPRLQKLNWIATYPDVIVRRDLVCLRYVAIKAEERGAALKNIHINTGFRWKGDDAKMEWWGWDGGNPKFERQLARSRAFLGDLVWDIGKNSVAATYEIQQLTELTGDYL
ncbi:hypothetical protein OQA88_8295 [Cercophora sp. LCS_1]